MLVPSEEACFLPNRLLTDHSVEREAGRFCIRAAVVGIESKVDRAPIGRDEVVVAQVGYRDRLPGLRVRTIPQVGDDLVSSKRPSQRPTVDR